MSIYRHQTNIKLDDFTKQTLDKLTEELTKKVGFKISRADAVRMAILYAYFVGIKKMSVEKAAKIIEQQGIYSLSILRDRE